MCRKGSLEDKGELCQRLFYPDAFPVKSILAKRCMLTHGRFLKYTKYGLWNRLIKMIGQRKSGRNALYYKSNSNCQEGEDLVTLSLSRILPVVLSFFPLNKYPTCFTILFLCGNSFLQSWRPGPLSLITGLLARIWCSHCCNPTSVSGWESKPFGSCCRLRSPWPGIQPTPPALQGGFLITRPPETSLIILSLTWCLHS